MVKTKYFRNICRASQTLRALACISECARALSKRAHAHNQAAQCCHLFRSFFCGTLFFVKMVIKLWFVFAPFCNSLSFVSLRSRSLVCHLVKVKFCLCAKKASNFCSTLNVFVCVSEGANKTCAIVWVWTREKWNVCFVFFFFWKFCSIRNQIWEFWHVSRYLRWYRSIRKRQPRVACCC